MPPPHGEVLAPHSGILNAGSLDTNPPPYKIREPSCHGDKANYHKHKAGKMMVDDSVTLHFEAQTVHIDKIRGMAMVALYRGNSCYISF